METKLTLVLDQKIIARAKSYASHKKTSVSKLVEAYLEKITVDENETTEISPLVKSLSGVLTLPAELDHKKEYGDHLADKYLHD
ncbi:MULTISPECIES: DUF6364 family protein [Rufibacter]|uniref:Antitoxin n=1 Tax=Rufibacter quisquiliarum TaxID=1549639 RepID=A0A839GL94_9BACT|nr:DUF6364 family protein [Rufibacter quisquiliarum]MBA9079612.1 hypothetical protein [Rufibacter quisquiliarum]